MFELDRSHEVFVERDWCLRSLLGQAAGRQLDNVANSYLIENINASLVDDRETTVGHITKCKVVDCGLSCLHTNERGILKLIGEAGEAFCGEQGNF